MGNMDIGIAILFISFFGLMILRVPVTFCLITSAVLAGLYMGIPVMAVFMRVGDGVESFTFLAIPFFILAGEIMAAGGISDRLVKVADVMVGRFRGGLAYANVIDSTFFGGISGSPTADVSSLGAITIPMMEKQGYRRDFTVAITVATATQALIIPPSHNMVIYGMAAGGVSTGRLFLAGIVPGLLLGGSMMVLVAYLTKKHNYPRGPKYGLKEIITTLIDGFAGLMTIVIIIMGVSTGIFTVTESAAIASLYAFILTFIVYREVKFREIWGILGRTCRTLAMVLSIIAAANGFCWIMSYLRIPAMVTNMLMDIAPLILIVTPILIPVVNQIGMDPVQFGIIIMVNMAIGSLTPPVGSTLFAGCAVGHISIEKVTKSLLPFYVSMIVVLILVTYVPAVMLTGGYMAAGRLDGKMLTLTHTKQAYAAYASGQMERQEYKNVVKNACPTPGACPFMGTANTMCAMAELLGLSPHGNASVRSQSPKWHDMARQAGNVIAQEVKQEIKPRDFITKESFENVVSYMMATGGSTNSLIHIPAIANQMGIEMLPEEFDRISREVPVISAIYPNHPSYTMEEFDRDGGICAVVAELLKAGKMNGEAGGMFGTIKEKAALGEHSPSDVIRSVEKPIHHHGGLAVLHGNIGTDSAIVKFSAVEPEAWTFQGPARCYDSQDEAWEAMIRDEILPGDVVVIRYEGPKGSPGMPHMETFMAAVLGKKMGTRIALVSDGRFSGATGGLAIGHVSPEAYEGDPIALIRNGDRIYINIEERTLNVDVTEEEMERRRKEWKPVEKPASGWLELYRKSCTSAHRGACVFWK